MKSLCSCSFVKGVCVFVIKCVCAVDLEFSSFCSLQTEQVEQLPAELSRMLAACRKHAVWILQAAVIAGNNPTGDEAQAAWITLDVTHTHTHRQSAS